jgi:hypothetical protein
MKTANKVHIFSARWPPLLETVLPAVARHALPAACFRRCHRPQRPRLAHCCRRRRRRRFAIAQRESGPRSCARLRVKKSDGVAHARLGPDRGRGAGGHRGRRCGGGPQRGGSSGQRRDPVCFIRRLAATAARNIFAANQGKTLSTSTSNDMKSMQIKKKKNHKKRNNTDMGWEKCVKK